MKIILTVVAALGLSATALADDAVQMKEFEANGLILSGAEYWPYHGVTDINYPDDVLWGFYPVEGQAPEGETEVNPASATPAAVACAAKAYQKLQSFFATENESFRRVLALGATSDITNKFYLWTNDYTDAATPYPFGVRPNKFWYWKRNPQVPGRTAGFWKWESTVTQTGECLIPEDAQIQAYIDQKLAELSAQ